MVVGVNHVHTVLYNFFVFPTVKLAPIVLGPGIRARSGLLDILKCICRKTGRVARICGRILGHTTSRVSRDLIVLDNFLVQGRGQSNQNLVVVGALIVPLVGRLVVHVQVYHIRDEGAGVEG